MIITMSESNQELAFNQAYCARVKALREGHNNWTAEQMATALGIPPDRYRKYEVRSPLPVYLLERFCLIVDRDISYVVTGRHDKRLQSVSVARDRIRA